ncbi:hypothetical protein FB567DRAFT_510801 [Paraphoma chrysanthemicola]|uniref:Uncharacterized protein n=1 Tax=Paraphoma chrysanthemicola TaxID=798071 RepID=A0A8K0RGS2_9PLEO|nr:hypothetical protein FB567DRAFT_510801 [Paraphoma chrysanthemicola]
MSNLLTMEAREGQGVRSSLKVQSAPISSRTVESTNQHTAVQSAGSASPSYSRDAPAEEQRYVPGGTYSRMYRHSKGVIDKCRKAIKDFIPALQQTKHKRKQSATGRSSAAASSIRTPSPTPPSSSQRNARRSSSSSRMRSIRGRRSIWKQDGRVIIENEHGRERKQHAIVLFDPQCQKDVVSTVFLQERFGLSFDGLTQEALGYSITGQEEFVSVGRQAIRWWAPNLNRYENAFCRVVRSSRFDLIIGEETITKLDIFKPGLIAAFMTPRAGLHGKLAPVALDL